MFCTKYADIINKLNTDLINGTELNADNNAERGKHGQRYVLVAGSGRSARSEAGYNYTKNFDHDLDFWRLYNDRRKYLGYSEQDVERIAKFVELKKDEEDKKRLSREEDFKKRRSVGEDKKRRVEEVSRQIENDDSEEDKFR